jgi:hypothetical protein
MAEFFHDNENGGLRMKRFPWKNVLLITMAALLVLSALLPLCYTALQG